MMQWLWLAAASRRGTVVLDGSDWLRVPDLYDLVSLDPFLRYLRTVPVHLLIASDYPEHLLISLLRQCHIPGEYQTTSEFFAQSDGWNTLTEDSEADEVDDIVTRRIVVWDTRNSLDMELLAKWCQPRLSAPAMAELPTARAPKERWYPIVDKTRCVGCLECVNFCLFGVYETGTDGKPKVVQPDACRPGCPACARVCLNQAIFFPYYDDSMISGETLGETAELAESTKTMAADETIGSEESTDANAQPISPRLAAIRRARAERKECKKKKSEPETQEEAVERWMRELDELES